VGVLAGGFGTSHVLFSPKGVEAQADRVFAGMREIGRRVRALDPDVIVLISSDHLNNFTLSMQANFAIGIADEFTPLGDTGVPKVPFHGHRDFAEALVRFAAPRGFDLVQVEEARPDHGFMIPNLIVNPGGAVPVVPLFVNCNFSPPPSPARCFELGRTLRAMVETERPAKERTVVIGAGGLSHWLCRAEEGKVNERFDRDFIERLISGRGEEIAALSAEAIEAEAGNGGLELTSWITMAGALAGARGEMVYYEAMPEWITGMGGIALTL
jgi:aromatic ring-opening dioxygenase catalytic subunit (LigB family)